MNISRTHTETDNKFTINLHFAEDLTLSLSENQASQIYHQYQAACITQYIYDNYEFGQKDLAMYYAKMAGDIADELMTFKGLDEEEAINQAMKEVQERIEDDE